MPQAPMTGSQGYRRWNMNLRAEYRRQLRVVNARVQHCRIFASSKQNILEPHSPGEGQHFWNGHGERPF